MTKPHNVDICVTCVSDKPPQLPLREELPSLGIEVVYNAQGVGARASKLESQKLVKKYQEWKDAHERELRTPKSPQQRHQQEAERQRYEDELRVPHALSYSSYQKGLADGERNALSSSNSLESSLEGSDRENQHPKVSRRNYAAPLEKNRAKNDDTSPPITALEFPTLSAEDMALKEAFDVFADAHFDDKVHGLANPESREKDMSPRQQNVDTGREGTGSINSDQSSNGIPLEVDVVASSSTENSSQRKKRDPEPSNQFTEPIRMEPAGMKHAGGMKATSMESTESKRGASKPERTATKPERTEPKQTEPVQTDPTEMEPKHDRYQTAKNTIKRIVQNAPIPFFHGASSPAGQTQDLTSDEGEGTTTSSEAGNSDTPEGYASPEDVGVSSLESLKSTSVRVSRTRNTDERYTEMYDLTELSDDDVGKLVFDEHVIEVSESSESQSESGTDLSTLSSLKAELSMTKGAGTDTGKGRGFHVFPSPAIQKQLPGLRFDAPTLNDKYGQIVLDLSDVKEDNGPGSPLVWSPSQQNQGNREPGVIHSPRKQAYPEQTQAYREENNDVDISNMPTAVTGHRAADKRHYPSGSRKEIKSLLDDSSSCYDGPQSESFPSASQRPEVLDQPYFDEGEEQEESWQEESWQEEGEEDYDPQPAPSHKQHRASPMPAIRQPQYSTFRGGSPSLKQSASRETNLKVSFSQDVERHIENIRKGGQSHRQADTADLKQPPATSFEDTYDFILQSNQTAAQRRDIEDLTIDLSQDADEIFDAILEGKGSYEIHSRRRQREHERERERESRQHNQTLGYEAPEFDVTPADRFLNALAYDSPLPGDFQRTLKEHAEIAGHKLPGSDIFPLHAACVREFPDRFGENDICRVTDLVQDIAQKRLLLEALVEASPETARHLDEAGDLPAHLMARQLMEWEARWYQKVYESARHGGREEGSGAGITSLYKAMSQCIDLLLKPIANDKSLCKKTGSLGVLLPLHLAAIFTVSYNTLKTLLEEYPEAAAMECELEEINTFIPNASIPLELHSRLSTDFPKWEIESNETEAAEHEIQLTQSTLDRSYGTTGAMRRSDLMFAFYPDVSPYRHETPRIRRLESRIRNEVSDMDASENMDLSPAAQTLWVWFCTYENPEDQDDYYGDSVRRIIQSLPARCVKYLAVVPTEDGTPVIDTALKSCVKIIRERLDDIASSAIPVPVKMNSTAFSLHHNSIALRLWEEEMASKFCLQGRGFAGVLCRTLFSITDNDFPSSFIFLPYKLVKDEEGRLGLESAEAAAVAMRFADCLLHLTSPNRITSFLNKKSIRFRGRPICQRSSRQEKVDSETDNLVEQLLSLYQDGPAYFYFVDEFTGVPIVPEHNSLYPLVISDPVDTVRRCLPLMLAGMILMRGEKALSVIAKVLLDKDVCVIQDNWIETATDLVGYLYTPQTEWSNSFLQDLFPLREELLDYIERGASSITPEAETKGLSSNWVVEFSLIKMIVEMYDTEHTVSGLYPKRSESKVLWTSQASFLNPNAGEHMYEIDFRSMMELRDQSDEEEMRALKRLKKKQEHQLNFSKKRSGGSDDSTTNGGYDLLFRELQVGDSLSSASSSGSEAQAEKKADPRAKMMLPQKDPEPEIRSPPQIVRKRAPAAQPVSLLCFDEDFDLDEVLQMRILLDEQEAKLEFLKEKIDALEVAEGQLHEQEEKLGDMLSAINNQKNDLLQGPSQRGLTQARRLLLRICELEDRLLVRQVEVGQLHNDICLFELDSQKTDEVDYYLGDGFY